MDNLQKLQSVQKNHSTEEACDWGLPIVISGTAHRQMIRAWFCPTQEGQQFSCMI